MFTPVAGYFEISKSNQTVFSDARSNDLLIYATTPEQHVLIGVAASNARSALQIRADHLRIQQPVLGDALLGGGLLLEGVSLCNQTLSASALQKLPDAANLRVEGTAFSNATVHTRHVRLQHLDAPEGQDTFRVGGLTVSNDTLMATRVTGPSDDVPLHLGGGDGVRVHANGDIEAVRMLADAVSAYELEVLGANAYLPDVHARNLKYAAGTHHQLRVGEAGIAFSNDQLTVPHIAIHTLQGSDSNGIQVLGRMSMEHVQADAVSGTTSNLRVSGALLPADPQADLGSAAQPYHAMYANHMHLSNAHLYVDPETRFLRFDNQHCDIPMILRAKAIQLGDDDGDESEKLLVRVSREGYLQTLSSTLGAPKPLVQNLYSFCNHIGIGVPEPTVALDVAGSVHATGDLNVDGHIHLPGYSNTPTQDRIWRTGDRPDNTIQIRNGATDDELLRITADGHVGIGMHPTSRLQIRGDLRIDQGRLIINNEVIASSGGLTGVSKVEDGLRLNVDVPQHRFQFTHGLSNEVAALLGDGELQLHAGKLQLHNTRLERGFGEEPGLTLRAASTGNLASLGMGALVLSQGPQSVQYVSTLCNLPISEIKTRPNGLDVNLRHPAHDFRVRQDVDQRDLLKVTGTGDVWIPALAGSSAQAPLYVTPQGLLTPSSSDARLKSEIHPLHAYGLDEVLRLEPVTYRWNADAAAEKGAQREIGLVAQEVQPVIPEVVGQAAGTGHLFVDYAKLVPVLIKSIQQLASQVQELQSALKK